MSAPIETELVVLGAGPGGYAAAFLAADLGIKTIVVDLEADPGGVCLYRGCIPSKALLHAAKLLEETRHADAWGLHFGEPRIDLERLRGWKDEVVGGLTAGLGTLCSARGVEFVRGRGRFDGPTTLRVDAHDGARRELRFRHAIVATGSRPTVLPGFPEDDPRVMDSTTALELPDTPDTLLVVGGGYIGLEIGSVYAALGSRVTVVEMTDGLLPGADRDLVRPLAARLATRFESILLGTGVDGVDAGDDAVRVVLDGNGRAESRFDRVLVAVGRRPNSGGLGLETTGVVVDDAGFILVDSQRRTHESNVFAIGDVVGQPMLAHKASHEGRAAVEAIAGHKVEFDPAAIPAVVFTDPEVAWCGLTETEAKAAGRRVRVARFPWAASGRAMTLARPDGLTKLILDPDSGRVLGVGITGAGAGELIAEGVLAVEMAALAADLKLTIHPHPTLSETIMESAELFFGQATHLHRPRHTRNPA